MIIGLFGPAGSGKTTLAHAICNRFNEHGHRTRLFLSHRPAEGEHPSLNGHRDRTAGAAALMHRLARPTVELLRSAGHPLAGASDVRQTVELLRKLPPRGTFQLLKRFQYLLRLRSLFREAAQSDVIAVFDQGFVQAVCSLALASRAFTDERLAAALDLAPATDLLVHLDAPADCLATRLHNRRMSQGVFERWLEYAAVQSSSNVSVFELAHRLLLERGRTIVSASSIDADSLGWSVAEIERTIGIGRKQPERGTA